MRRPPLWLLPLALLACEPERSPGSDAAAGRPVDMTLDRPPDAAGDVAVDGVSAGGDADAGETADRSLGPLAADASAGVDARAPADVGSGIVVADCVDACVRLAECDGLDRRFDDEEECRLACAAAPYEDRIRWFGCMLDRACAQVAACEPPAAPMACPEACDAASACGAPYDADVCRARCAEAPHRFGRCVGLLDASCDLPRVSDCLAREVFRGCRSVCHSADACRGLDAGGCSAACVDCKAGCVGHLLSADALAPLFARRQLRCYAWEADTCDDLERCIDQTVVDAGPPPTAFALCTAWARCEGVGSCDRALERLAAEGPPALACAAGAVAEACDGPVDPAQLSAVVDRCAAGLELQVDAACTALADAGAACGLAVPDFEVCVGSVGTLTQVRLARAGLDCLSASDCSGFEACLEASTPAARCAAGCARMAACPDASAFACSDACVETWTHRRTQRHLRCLGEADCDAAVADCPAPEAPACVDFCARLAGCGLADVDCRLTCDDDALFAPDAHRLRRACVDEASDCGAMAGCLALP